MAVETKNLRQAGPAPPNPNPPAWERPLLRCGLYALFGLSAAVTLGGHTPEAANTAFLAAAVALAGLACSARR